MQATAFIQRFRSEIFQHERNIFQITIIRTDNETQSAWELPRLCKRATDRVQLPVFLFEKENILFYSVCNLFWFFFQILFIIN